MTVVYVSHYPGLGGANIACLKLMTSVRERHGVTPVFLLPMRGPVVAELERLGIRYHILHFASWRGSRTGLRKFVFAVVTTIVNLMMIYRAKWVLKDIHVDIVHGNSSLTGFAWFLSRALKCPLVWHQREFGEENYGFKYYYGKWLSGKILGSSSAVLAVSRAMENYYREFIRPADRVKTVYDGIDIQGVEGRMREETPPIGLSGEFRICMTGGISVGKNQIEVIRALKVLRQNGGLENLHFYILGAGTPEYERFLLQEIGKLGLVDRVHFLGHHSNVWPYLKQMDCAVCASLREGFGLSVVEAMYVGLPVVAARSGAMPEIVLDGQTGYLYELGDVMALGKSLLRVAHGELGPEQRKLSRRRVEENFSREKNADNVWSVYRQVLCQ